MRNAVRFLIFGVLLLLNALVFLILNKQDPAYGFYSGPASLVIGGALWLYFRKDQQY